MLHGSRLCKFCSQMLSFEFSMMNCQLQVIVVQNSQMMMMQMCLEIEHIQTRSVLIQPQA